MLLTAALVAGGSIFAAAQYTGGVYQNGVYVGQDNQNSDAYQRGWRDAQDDASHGRQSSTRISRYHNDADRQAYDQGYAQGYQAWVNGQNGIYNNGRRRGDCDRDDPNCYNGNNQVYAPNGQVYNQGRRRRGDHDCDSDDAYCNGYPNPNYRGNNNGNNGNYYPNGTYNGGYYGNGNGYNNGAQVAQQYGYNDGLREGADDRANGHSYRATSDTGYRLATNGYQAQFGSRDQYKQWYRQAYEQGYQQGYNGGANNGYGYPPRH
jgi:hypothetical protein